MAALTTAMKHLTLAPNQEFLDLLTTKYSGKEFTVEELQADEELVGFLTTKKAKKPKLSSHERASLAYNPEQCCARVWVSIKGKKGLAVQCTGTTGDAKEEGGICNRCAKPGNFLWLGRMDGPMPPLYPEPVMKDPENKKWKDGAPHYLMQDAEGKPIEMPVEEPKKKKASIGSSGSAEPKKRGRKPGSKNKKKKSSVEEDQAAEIAKLKEMLAAKAEKSDSEETTDLTQSEEEAAGCGLEEESPKKEEEEEEEEDEYESLVFEGVEYQKNKQDDTVLDLEDFSVVGVWKDGGIVWEDDEVKAAHESKK